MSANVRHSSETNEHYSPEQFVEAARVVMGSIDLDPATSSLANEVVKAKAIFTAASNGFEREWYGNVWLNPPGGKCDAHGVTVTSVHRDRYRVAVIKKNKRWVCGDACDHVHDDITQRWECGIGCDHEHTGAQSSQKAWWFKLAREWVEGRVDQAMFVAFSLELLQTTQSNRPEALPYALAFPICYPSTRIAYDKVGDAKREESDSPPHSSALIYLPPLALDRRADAIAIFAAAFGTFGHVNEALDRLALEACERRVLRLANVADPTAPPSSAESRTPPAADGRNQTYLQF